MPSPAKYRLLHRSRVDLGDAADGVCEGARAGPERLPALRQVTWERGGVWTYTFGRSAKVGFVSMGGSGFTSSFDYLGVYALD